MKRMAPAPHSRSLLGVALVLALACYAGVELVQPHKKGNASSVAEAATKAERSGIDIIDILTKARTAKSFTNEAIADEDLDVILKAGINAPSARNSQPWHFSVVRDAEILEEIESSMGGGGGMMVPPPGGQAPSQGGQTPPPGGPAPAPAQGRVGGAPRRLSLASAKVAIVVSSTSNLSTDPFDCGLACQNMSVAAMVLGYATKIVSSPTDAINGARSDYFHKLLGIPKAMNAVAVLLIGVSDESVDAITGASTRKAFDDVVTYVTR